MERIEFYSRKGEHGYMSNFAYYPITIEGKIWPTSEHYYQGQKFAGTKYETKVRQCESPMDAANMGRKKTLPLRSDWEQVKDDIMRKVVREKFSQHKNLQQKLIDTGDAILVEHTANDSYWGDGGNGTGKNMLGKILMEIREELRRV